MDLRVVVVVALALLLIVFFVLRSRASKSVTAGSPVERRRARVVARREVKVGDRLRRVVGFQIVGPDGRDREDFAVDDRAWDRLVEGVEGTLRSQDERFLGFSADDAASRDGAG